MSNTSELRSSQIIVPTWFSDNGAGPFGWGWLIPDWLPLVGSYAKAARVHDWEYAIGGYIGNGDDQFLASLNQLKNAGTKVGRFEADLRFRDAIIENATKLPWGKNVVAWAVAHLYYLSLRLVGGKCYYFYPKPMQ